MTFKIIAKNDDKDVSPLGLTLVAKYDPLHLYIYVDLNSTNKNSDYLICQGREPLICRSTSFSNYIETTHFENGDSVLMTRRNENGVILERMEFFSDGSGQPIYSYTDDNGGGLWNVFWDEKNGKLYTRSNLCWILKGAKSTNEK